MNTKQELIQYYKWLRQYGLNDSHSGNASIRENDYFWVTPTGACADTLIESELIKCKTSEPPAEGASLDAALHAAVYRKNPAVNAVLHSHGAYTVAMTMKGENFVPFDFEGQFYFGQIPVIDLDYNRVLTDAAEQVAEHLLASKAVVVCGHGAYAAAENLNLGYKWSCSLELSAKTAFLALQAGTYPKG